MPVGAAARLTQAAAARRLSVSAAAPVRAARQPEPRPPRRHVPVTEEESAVQQRRPERRADARRLYVAVLGIPNSGKSTLINGLLSWPVCSVSSKVHTTRSCSRAALTVGDTQLVLEDTPGLVTDAERRRHGLEAGLLTEPAAALRRADLVCVLHDVSDPRNRHGLSAKVQRLLFAEPRRPAVLVLTKVDTLLRKRRLLELTHELTEGCVEGCEVPRRAARRAAPARLDAERLLGRAAPPPEPEPEPDGLERFRAQGVQFAAGFVDRSGPPPPPDAEHRRLVLAGAADQLTPAQLDALSQRWRCWPLFRRVFMTAALEGAGVAALSQYLLAEARPGAWRFSADLVTDQRPRRLAADLVRAHLLEHLPAEVPYSISCEVTQWERGESDALAVEMRLHCGKLSHSRLVLRRIRAIARDAEQALRDAFRTELVLRLCVEPSPESWRRDGF